MNQPGKLNAAAFKEIGRPFGVAPDSGFSKHQQTLSNAAQNVYSIGNSQKSPGFASSAAASPLLSQLPKQVGGKINGSNQTANPKSPATSPRSGRVMQQSPQRARAVQDTQPRSVQPGYQKQQKCSPNPAQTQSQARVPQSSPTVASHNRPLSPSPAAQHSALHQPVELSKIAPGRALLGQQTLPQEQILPQYLQTAPAPNSSPVVPQQSSQENSLQRVASQPILSSTKVKIVTLPRQRLLKTSPASTAAHLERVPAEDIPNLIEKNMETNLNLHFDSSHTSQKQENALHSSASFDQQPIRPPQKTHSAELPRKVAIVRAVNKEATPAPAEPLWYPVPDPDASPGLGRKAPAESQPQSQPTFAFDSKVQVSTTPGPTRGRRNAGLDRTAVMIAGVHRVLGESN